MNHMQPDGLFPKSFHTQDSSSTVVTCISGDIDVGGGIIIVNDGEAVSTEDQPFDVVEGGLVFDSPWRERFVAFFGGEWGEDAGVLCQCR